jgi:hypothetical protein
MTGMKTPQEWKLKKFPTLKQTAETVLNFFAILK